MFTSLPSAPALLWVGDTWLGVSGGWISPRMIPADNAVEVCTQTFPADAAQRVELHWRTPSDGDGGVIPMRHELDGAGPFRDNRQWVATLPADRVRAGDAVVYWIRAEGAGGEVLWDSAGGANHAFTPQRFTVAWVGGFGQWRPTSGSYSPGGLLNDDGTTAIGCENHGASLSSYVERAVRVYAPGLTDHAYASDEQRRAAARILRGELCTDASPEGWIAVPLAFRAQVGHDFVYSYLSYNQMCSSGSDLAKGLADGRYGYKLRFSTDAGATWVERGYGADGAEPIPLQFAVSCSYFNDPYDCHPPSSSYYSFTWTGGSTPAGGWPPAWVMRFSGVRPGGTAADWRVLTNKTASALALTRLALTGPDAALFTLALADPVSGAPIAAGSRITLAPHEGVRLDVTFAPQAASGTLPFMAAVSAWREEIPAGAGGPAVAALVDSLVYLRAHVP